MKTLITGGTGSFGKAYLQAVGGSVRVLSRDEEKQRRMAQLFGDVEFVIGDIRDRVGSMTGSGDSASTAAPAATTPAPPPAAEPAAPASEAVADDPSGDEPAQTT